MSIWNARLAVADGINVAGYAFLATGAAAAVLTVFYSGMIAQVAGVVAAALTVAGVLMTFWASGVRDRHSDRLIADANAEAARAIARAAEANEKAESEKLARVKIEQKLADRTVEHAASLVDALKPHEGQPYKVTTFWDMREPMQLANFLHKVLQTSGWQYQEHGPEGSFLLGGIEGVEVYFHPSAPSKHKDAAQALVAALNAAGVQAKTKHASGPSTEFVFMNVGTKP